jgi:hypothetical protein
VADTTEALLDSGRPNDSFVVVDVAATPPSWLAKARMRTLEHPMAVDSNDVAMKRNFAVALSKALHWRTILFVDDDVQTISRAQLSRAVDLLDGRDRGGHPRQVVGWKFHRFPDFSAVGHAYGSGSQERPAFIGGGALAIYCPAPVPFFPAIYNEDLLFVLPALRDDPQSVCVVGTLKQDEYLPFDSATTARQEFGEVLAQGLYLLNREAGHSSTAGDPEFWRGVLADRAAFLGSSATRLDRVGKASAVACLRLARAQHTGEWPQLLADYVNDWESDLLLWRGAVGTLPTMTDLREAVRTLGW